MFLEIISWNKIIFLRIRNALRNIFWKKENLLVLRKYFLRKFLTKKKILAILPIQIFLFWENISQNKIFFLKIRKLFFCCAVYFLNEYLHRNLPVENHYFCFGAAVIIDNHFGQTALFDILQPTSASAGCNVSTNAVGLSD